MSATASNRLRKEFLEVIKPYLDAGTLTIENGRHHAKLKRADGRIFTVPGSTGDRRAIKNFKSDIRKFVAEGQP